MKQPKLTPIIVDVTRDRLALASKVNAEPLVFKFTPEMISDLEVVNKEELRIKLHDFIVENKIKPAPLIIILEESVFFAKDYPGAEPSMDEVQSFIDTVPFAGVSSKVFKMNNGHKLVVINRDLYQSLQQVFEKLQFPLLSVVPGFVLTTINAPLQFSADSSRIIYKKLDIVLASSFAGNGSEDGSFAEKREAWLEKHKVVVVLLVLVLVGVCIAVAMMTLRKKPPTVKPLVVSAPRQVETETTEATPTPAVETVPPEEIQKLSSEVLNGSGVAGMAASWEAKLREWGFTDVKTGNTAITNGVKVTFSQKVPENLRTQIKEELKKQTSEIVATESAASNTDIILVIGK
jgi:hypothetical protein